MPVRLRESVGLEAELLVMVICPVEVPEAGGVKAMLIVALWPGESVTGNVAPDAVKFAPVTLTALTVTGWDPVEDSVTDCVEVVLTVTFPKFTVVALTVRSGAEGDI